MRSLTTVFLLMLISACISLPPKPIGEYTSPNRIFAVKVPSASNFAEIPFKAKVLESMGDDNYDRVMFYVKDFGEYLVAGVRHLPAENIAAMDQAEHRTVLRNISESSLMVWRGDLVEFPELYEETFFDCKYGEALKRVYQAKGGSLLSSWQPGQTNMKVWDTSIVSIVARQGATMIYVMAQNDASSKNVSLISMQATIFFNNIKVLPAG